MPMQNPETTENYGKVKVISTVRRKNRPQGLRKPWDYVLSIAEIREFAQAFRPLFEEISKDQISPEAFEGPDLYRTSYVPPKGEFYPYTKPQGVEIYAAIKGTSTFTSEKRWDDICTRFQEILHVHLGSDANAYLGSYTPGDYGDQNRCYELYARFDTHIFYEEYLPIKEATQDFDDLWYPALKKRRKHSS